MSDWLAKLGLDKFVAHAHAGKDDIPSSIIVNGKGRISKPKSELSPKEKMPLAVFHVEQVCMHLLPITTVLQVSTSHFYCHLPSLSKIL